MYSSLKLFPFMIEFHPQKSKSSRFQIISNPKIEKRKKKTFQIVCGVYKISARPNSFMGKSEE